MKKYLLLSICALLFASCSKSAYLTYEPVMEIAEAKSLSVSLIKFEDARTRDEIGSYRNTLYMPIWDLSSKTNVLDWATEALRIECMNAGYSISANADGANIEIEGKVIEVFCDTYLTYSGTVRVELKARKDGDLLFANEYCGEESGGINWFNSANTSSETLKKGLQSVYCQFFADLQEAFPIRQD